MGSSEMQDSNRELISDQEAAVGLSELHIEGLIQFREEDDVQLTDKGIDYAWDLFHEHSPKEMLALTLLWDRIGRIVEVERD